MGAAIAAAAIGFHWPWGRKGSCDRVINCRTCWRCNWRHYRWFLGE
jgi:hypothetical protein